MPAVEANADKVIARGFEIGTIATTITTAFTVCDSCCRTYPASFIICQNCFARLRVVEKNFLSQGEKPALPIEVVWTLERLTDELTLQLAAVEEIHGDNVRVRKYYAQASDLLYNIPIYRPALPFIINLSDLAERLVEELQECTKVGFD